MKTNCILLAGLAALLLPVSCGHPSAAPAPLRLSCSAPSFLAPGDTVALLSPSYATAMENVDGAAETLRAWGFVPVVGPNVGKEYLGKYAGTLEERLSDLHWAQEDPSIKAIICNRGGYGSIRYVNTLPLETLSAHPKWLVGFSDITTLHGMETCAGVMSIHGTMGAFLAASHGEDQSSLLLRDMLTGTLPAYSIPAHPQNVPGKASGVLVGGNLSTFSPVLGTAADPTRSEGFILFIEEVEEDMSHIDRMMNTLILNGVLDRCAGVVLGGFTDCEANLGYGSVEELLCSYLRGYGIPVCCGFPAGHGDVNLPLLMGAPASLEVTPAGASLSFEAGGRQSPVVWTGM